MLKIYFDIIFLISFFFEIRFFDFKIFRFARIYTFLILQLCDNFDRVFLFGDTEFIFAKS